MIEIYSQEWCPYCIKAKRLLDSKEVEYTVRDITSDRKLEREMIERSGRRTVPQIFIDGEGIGGYDDLARLNAAGELDRILGRSAEPAPEKLYDLAVIGSGNSGLEAAIEMSTIAEGVYLIAREGLSGDRILQDKVKSSGKITCLLNHEPMEIHGDRGVEGLTVRDLETGKDRRLEVEGVFIEIGLAPNSDFVLDLVETNPTGEILTGRDGSTGVHGVFAAGDVTDGPFKQIVIAAGDGARAALSAFKYLLQQV